MHDIGKIGIPDSILLKPGKLDADEWKIMKKHAEYGADILKGSDSRLIKLSERIARYHHEKWDGNGYPYGLKGNDIPIEARIVALTDVFDALTSNRPYKKAFSVDEALNIIRKESGTHFDPNIVNVFIEILPEIIKIKEDYPVEDQ